MKTNEVNQAKRDLIERYGTAALRLYVGLLINSALSEDFDEFFLEKMVQIGGESYRNKMNEIRMDLRKLPYQVLKPVLKRFI